MDLATWWSGLFTGMSPASFINFSFLPKYGVYFLQALGYTLLLAVVSVALAVIPALLLAFMRLSKNRFVRGVSGAYIAIFRSTPLLVQLSIIYFGLFGAISLRSSAQAFLLSTQARLRPRARWVFPPRRR